MNNSTSVRLEGIHCTFDIERPGPRIVVLRIQGFDIGELGDAPFRVLADDVAADRADPRPIELFIDARATRGATVAVSGGWAAWLKRNKRHFRHVSMLTGSRFIQMTATFVRRFSDLEQMRIYTDPKAFELALTQAIVATRVS